MSVITDVAVMFENMNKALKFELELGYKDQNDRPVNLLIADSYRAGGTKVFCSAIGLGAFNHLYAEEFKNWLFEIADKYKVGFVAIMDSEYGELSIVSNRIGRTATSIESAPSVNSL